MDNASLRCFFPCTMHNRWIIIIILLLLSVSSACMKKIIVITVSLKVSGSCENIDLVFQLASYNYTFQNNFQV